MYNEDVLKKISNSKIFKSIIRYIEQPDILGLEEAFECKKRYTCIKCVSNNGELYRIPITVIVY
jgi:hypothetical protein